MDIQNLVPVDYSNQRVLLTSQVAEVYGTSPARIRDNFKRAKKHFDEGVHYFKVEGDELRAMRERAMCALKSYAPSPFPKGGNAVILYTAQGCARHCKMLNTPEAWAMFDALEKHYFNPATHVAPPVEDSLFPDEEPVKKIRRAPTPELAVVYAVLLSNSLVKIGYTKDLTDRLKDLQKETKADIMAWATSAVITRDEAILLERALKVKFFPHIVTGEFFNVDFDAVKAALVGDDKFNKLLALAEKVNSPDEKDKLLIRAAKLI